MGRGRSSRRSTCAHTRRSSSTATGAETRIALTPNRPVADVTREVLEAVRAPGRRRRDQPDAAGGSLGGSARRGHRARDLRARSGRHLLHGGDAGRPRARRVPGLLSRALDAGERLVGDLRPGGLALLGQAGRSTVQTTSSRATAATPSRSRSAGGPATATTTGPPSSPSRIRRRRDLPRLSSIPRPPTGTATSASSCSTGRTSGRRRPARPRPRVRPLGLPPRLRRLRLGSRPGANRRGRAAGPCTAHPFTP